MGKRAHRPFPKHDFGITDRMFRENGYSTADMISDMDPRERDLFSAHAERNGRSALSDLRITRETFDWFAPVSLRGGRRPAYEEIAIGKREARWKLDLFTRSHRAGFGHD